MQGLKQTKKSFLLLLTLPSIEWPLDSHVVCSFSAVTALKSVSDNDSPRQLKSINNSHNCFSNNSQPINVLITFIQHLAER